MRTGSSFSFSTMDTIARARTSLPPPGPVCTTNSIGLTGLKPCADTGTADMSIATSVAASASHGSRVMGYLLGSSLRGTSANGLDATLFQDAAHRIRVLVTELPQLGAAHEAVLEQVVLEILPPARRLHELREGVLPVGDRVRRHARRPD